VDKVGIRANVSGEVVRRISQFQGKTGIKFFSDAVGAYIEYLEGKAYKAAAVRSASDRAGK
jgi:3-phosphoglycerate kinase